MWKLVDVQIIYKKLYQRELVTSDWFFVIRNNSGVQIFRNDEKARQRHLPKMYTLVVTMNWNRFRKIFRIRFCIFYNRSELSHCIHKEVNPLRSKILVDQSWVNNPQYLMNTQRGQSSNVLKPTILTPYILYFVSMTSNKLQCL